MTPRFSTVIDTTGPNARMPFIHDTAVVLMKQANVDPAEIMDMSLRVDNAKTYAEALAVVREWFVVDVGDGR